MKRDQTTDTGRFCIGVRQLQTRLQRDLGMDLAMARLERRGVDPYNAAGGFERQNAWVRVGKR